MKTIYEELSGIPGELILTKKVTQQLIINRNVKRENFILINQAIIKTKISCWLLYGTLIGAAREDDFIENDHDTDFGLFQKDMVKLVPFFKELKNNGFNIVRCYSNNSLISFERKKEFIDFYLWIDRGNYFDCCGTHFKREYLDSFETIIFRNKPFLVPNKYKELLTILYGNWLIPVEGVTGKIPKEWAELGRK